MELAEVLRRRKMTRDFLGAPVSEDDLAAVLSAGGRMPSAGRSQGFAVVALRGSQTANFWDVTLPEPRRSSFAWPGLLLAPVILVACSEPRAYVERYAEADKAATGLGAGVDSWPVGYWTLDAGMAIGAMLLAATDRGLGALFFGVFDAEAGLRRALSIPDEVDVLGAIALGHPGPDARPGRSASRPSRGDVVYEGSWGAAPSARRNVATSPSTSDAGASHAQFRQT